MNLTPVSYQPGDRSSPDKNGDGRITPNEFIKACPSFDVAQWLEQHAIA